MVLDNEMQLTKEFFKSNCINLSDIWLEKCVEWVREENVGSTQMEINSQVFLNLMCNICNAMYS